MTPAHDHEALTDADISVLQVLIRRNGRVTSRETLTRLAGLETASRRRADVCLVALRRVLGSDAISTVRQRGWILTERGLKSATDFLDQRLEQKP